jgi:hypothetical protein
MVRSDGRGCWRDGAGSATGALTCGTGARGEAEALEARVSRAVSGGAPGRGARRGHPHAATAGGATSDAGAGAWCVQRPAAQGIMEYGQAVALPG